MKSSYIQGPLVKSPSSRVGDGEGGGGSPAKQIELLTDLTDESVM